MKFRIAAAAKQDFKDIAAYIARDNPVRAQSFILEIYEKIRVVAEAPFTYQARDEWHQGLRSALHQSYHIVFRVENDVVEIARILHGARDIENIF
jgi:toxin ParE1/3/4